MTEGQGGRYRYVIFAMIVLISLVNYVDRGAMAFAAGPINTEYGFNRIAWGQVLGYFGYGYMFGALIGGALADRLGPRRVWIIVGSAWSAFEIATAYSGEIGMAMFGGSALAGFAVVRVLFGLAEGPTYSIINRTMANWATPRERSFAVSLGLLGVPVGALLSAPVAVGLILATGSWRLMFVVLGVVSLLLLAVFARMLTDKPEEHKKVSADELNEIVGSKLASDASGRNAPPQRWQKFFSNRTLVCNTIGYFAFQYVNFMILSWIPKYLEDQFHFNLQSVWYIAMIPWIGPCFTVILGGRLSDWILRRTGKLHLARNGLAASVLLLTTATFLLVSRATGPIEVVALLAIGNSLNFLANPVYWTVVIDTAPESTGTFSGIMHFFVNIAAVAAPMLTGYLSQHYGYSSMFVATACITLTGTVAMLCVRRQTTSVSVSVNAG